MPLALQCAITFWKAAFKPKQLPDVLKPQFSFACRIPLPGGHAPAAAQPCPTSWLQPWETRHVIASIPAITLSLAGARLLCKRHALPGPSLHAPMAERHNAAIITPTLC